MPRPPARAKSAVASPAPLKRPGSRLVPSTWMSNPQTLRERTYVARNRGGRTKRGVGSTIGSVNVMLRRQVSVRAVRPRRRMGQRTRRTSASRSGPTEMEAMGMSSTLDPLQVLVGAGRQVRPAPGRGRGAPASLRSSARTGRQRSTSSVTRVPLPHHQRLHVAQRFGERTGPRGPRAPRPRARRRAGARGRRGRAARHRIFMTDRPRRSSAASGAAGERMASARSAAPEGPA